MFIRAGDFTRQFFPFHSFVAQELLAGRLPLWNPNMLGGHPFLADVQTAVFYPLTFIWALLFGRDGLTPAELQYRVVASYLLAGSFSYLCVFDLSGVRLGALAGALVFTLGSFLTSYPMEQMPILETAIWLPLSILFVERSFRQSRAVLWVGLSALSVALGLFAGHMQTDLYVIYAVGAYTLYRWADTAWGHSGRLAGLWRAMPELALRFAGTFGLALGLFAVQLLPTVELIGLSNRVQLAYSEAAIGYQPSTLLGIVIPDWQDGHSAYVGIVALLLGSLAVTGGRGLRRGFWVILALLATTLATGGNGPLFPVLYRVAPGFNTFRDQERAVLLLALSTAVLAGQGIAILLRGTTSSDRRVSAQSLLPVVSLALAVAGIAVWKVGMLGDAGRWIYLACVGLSGVVLMHLRPTRQSERLIVGLVLVAIISADLFAVNAGRNLRSGQPWPSDDVNAVTSLVQQDVAERAPGDPFRVRTQTVDEDAFPPDTGHLVGLQQAGGDTPLYQQRILDFQNRDWEWRFWELMNVKYTFSRRDLGNSGIDYLGQAGALRVYRMQWPLPHFWAVRDFRVAGSPTEALALTYDKNLSPAQVVVLEEAPGVSFPAPQRPKQEFRLLDGSTQHLRVRTSTDSPAVMVASEAFYPGWRAFVDGQETKILRADYYLRAIVLPDGQHTVEFKYDPPSLWTGAVVSLFSASILAGLLLLGARGPARSSHRPG